MSELSKSMFLVLSAVMATVQVFGIIAHGQDPLGILNLVGAMAFGVVFVVTIFQRQDP